MHRIIGPYRVTRESPGELKILDTRDGRVGGVSFTVSAQLSDEDFLFSLDADDCEGYMPEPIRPPLVEDHAPSTNAIAKGICAVLLIAIVILVWRWATKGGLV